MKLSSSKPEQGHPESRPFCFCKGHAFGCALLAFALGCGANPAPAPSVVGDASRRYAAVQLEEQPRATATALVLSDTRALSCNHALPDGAEFHLIQNGERYGIKGIIERHPRLDLVLFETESPLVSEPIQWRDDPPQTGSSIFAIGTPYGLKQSYLEGTIGMKLRMPDDFPFPSDPLIQTNGIAYPGVSGAAVYTMDGKSIGLSCTAYGTSADGIGFVVPALLVQRFLEDAEADN